MWDIRLAIYVQSMLHFAQEVTIKKGFGQANHCKCIWGLPAGSSWNSSLELSMLPRFLQDPSRIVLNGSSAMSSGSSYLALGFHILPHHLQIAHFSSSVTGKLSQAGLGVPWNGHVDYHGLLCRVAIGDIW